MLKAWRERKSEQRIQFAKQALQEKPDYVPAMLLIAEEEYTMHVDVSYNISLLILVLYSA